MNVSTLRRWLELRTVSFGRTVLARRCIDSCTAMDNEMASRPPVVPDWADVQYRSGSGGFEVTGLEAGGVVGFVHKAKVDPGSVQRKIVYAAAAVGLLLMVFMLAGGDSSNPPPPAPPVTPSTSITTEPPESTVDTVPVGGPSSQGSSNSPGPPTPHAQPPPKTPTSSTGASSGYGDGYSSETSGTDHQNFAESYTISGCLDESHCGVFQRVEADCSVESSQYCPPTPGRPGWTDQRCDGVPVYQKVEDGTAAGGYSSGERPVLMRLYYDDGIPPVRHTPGGSADLAPRRRPGTVWVVADESALTQCFLSDIYLSSGYSEDTTGDTPTAAVYNTGDFNTGYYHDTNGQAFHGWYELQDPNHLGPRSQIEIAAGGGGAGR